MAGRTNILFFCLNYLVLLNFVSSELTNMIDEDVLTTKAYVSWPNGTIPFYIDNEHFDQEQSISILTALSLFAFKTCLKFAPVMARPEPNDHVLLLENPTGVRKCTFNTEPHSKEEPHRVTLGYDCLKSPDIDMMIMKALGFPFEHNRAVRELYIEVQPENVEPGFLDLFTKDLRLPMELRAIPYDHNSVMHFRERDFSKNGHRTILFKNRNLRQERFGLSPLDLRKIDVVYGPECRLRDRQEKIELCQNYPGVARKKRDATDPPKSLRVNPAITPPPNITEENILENGTVQAVAYTNAVVKELGIEKEVEDIVQQVYKVGAAVLEKSKEKSCTNETKEALRTIASGMGKPSNKNILDIIGDIADYANTLVQRATQNLTQFCLESTSIIDYQRSSCPFFDKDRCPKTYRSTKSGNVKYSTQHRPVYLQSTKQPATHKRHIYDNHWLRTGNETSPGNASTDELKTSLPISDAKPDAAKSDLRSGHTRLPPPKMVYAPMYRSSNDSEKSEATVKSRRKREAPEEPATQNEKEVKPEKLRKMKKVESIKSAKRRFESQRFRVKKDTNQRDYERGGKEREWENSDVSSEKQSYKDEDRKERGGKRSPYEEREERDQLSEEVPRYENKEAPYELRNREEAEERSIERTRHKDQKPSEPTSVEEIHKGRGSKVSNENYYSRDYTIGNKNVHSKGRSKLGGKGYNNDRDKATERHRGDRDTEPENDDKSNENRHLVRHEEKGVNNHGREKSKNIDNKKDHDRLEQSKERYNKNDRIRVKGRQIDEREEDERSGKGGKISDEELERPKFSEMKKAIKKVDSREPLDDLELNSKQKPTPHKSLPPEVSERAKLLPQVLELDKKNREFYDERMWPDGVVRYVITAPDDVDIADVRSRLDEVNQILKRKTCARLEELTEEEADSYEDYLVLDNSPDYVTGRVGGKQNFGVVELLKGGQHRQHAAMMVMAMLGFYFEVSRHDRDKYIRVHTRHVRPDKLHHFEKIREDATFPLPYDYKSATHPAWQFWRQIGRTGISTVATYKQKDPDGSIMKSLGQNRQLLSDMDILKINSVYGVKCFQKTSKGRKKKGQEYQETKKQKEKSEEESSNKEDDD